MKPYPFFQVDAFTQQPFHGNPAAVVLLEQAMPDVWMQSVALEMNLSETAFLLPEADGWRLRWFTPAVEVRLCGHATLASAHTLFSNGILAPTAQAHFYTLSGLLTAEQRPGGWIELNFPTQNVQPGPVPVGLLEALNAPKPIYVGSNGVDLLVEFENEAVVRTLQPNFTALNAVEARGIIVTSRSIAPEYDFISRFFAPRVGVNEDPVTGSAHTCLTPYWSARLGKTILQAYQASARGGVLQVELVGERVLLRGQAVRVVQGQLLS